MGACLTSLASRLSLFLGLWLSLWWASASWGKSMEYSGEISNDSKTISLTITVKEIPNSLFTPKPQDYFRHLEIFVPKIGSDPILQMIPEADTQKESRNYSYYWTLDNSPSPTPSQTAGKFDMTFALRIMRNDLFLEAKTLDDAKETVEGKELITLRVQFWEYSPESKDGFILPSNPLDRTFRVERITDVPIEAPEISADNIINSYRSVNFSWKAKLSDIGEVTYTNQKKRIPEKTLVILMKDEAGVIDLPAKQVVNPNTGETVDKSCTYTPPEFSGASCIKCPSDQTPVDTKYTDLQAYPIYLASANPELEEIERYETVSNKSRSSSIKGLTNGENYVLVLQYENGGERSACFTVSPIRTASLTELNGAEEAELSSAKCFIATAAYGSPLDAHIRTFVWFRDNFLETFSWGRRFVDFYYTYSPTLAATIAESPLLQTLTRGALFLPAAFLSSVRILGTYPLEYVNAGGLMAVLALVGLLAQRRLGQRKKS